LTSENIPIRTIGAGFNLQPNVREVGFIDLLLLLWSKKLFVSAVPLVLGALAAVAAFVMPREYEATILLSPVSATSSDNELGAALGSQLGGLAAVVGLTSKESQTQAISIATLQSQVLTEGYIEQENLLPVLFWRKWDSVHNRWKTDNPDKMPTLWKGDIYFKKKVQAVEENPKSGLVAMTITWRDPLLAAKWANGLVKMTNDYLRNKAIAESERDIDYLNAQLAKTNAVELRQAIYSLMENQIEKEMLARGNEQYAFRVVDPAVPPEKQSSPLPAVWIGTAVLGGFLLSCLTVLLRARRSDIP